DLRERGEAGAGRQQSAAARRRLGRDVRGGHVILGRGQTVALALVGFADGARGGRDDGRVVALHEALECAARLAPALFLREQTSVSERPLRPERPRAPALRAARVRLERAGAIAARLAGAR